MLIRVPPRWELPESAVTDERAYLNRRQLMKSLVVAGATSVLGQACYLSADPDPEKLEETPESGFLKDLYPANKNFTYLADRPLTSEYNATHFNNYYEFSTNKSAVWRLVGKFVYEPWSLEVSGLVQNPQTYDVEKLVRQLSIEERIYRFRCVETWAMTVPWTGFQLSRLINLVQPLASAKFVKFTTIQDEDTMPGIAVTRRLPWPYTEALRLDEAMHPLAFMVTGVFGKPIPAQNGAPMRLIVPWKYGYKSVKSIVKMELTDTQPRTFWTSADPHEYDFLANVNPDVPHPRWSQATEQPVGGGPRVPTRLYNGYDDVASLYA